MRRAIVVPATCMALVLGAVAGCGSGSHGPGVATAGGAAVSAHPSATVSRQEQGRRFAQCMREHGVDMPDPNPNNPVKVMPSNVTKDKALQATKACQQYLPTDSLATLDPQQLAALHDFAQCMRDHGVDMPDPNPNSSAGSGLTFPKSALSGGASSAFDTAYNACKSRLPGNVGGVK